MSLSNHKKERLTNRLITFLQSLAIKQGKRFYRADGKNNLAVRVSKQGLAVFTVTYYNQQNKKTESVIGYFPATTVNEARIIASEFFINAQLGKELTLKSYRNAPTVNDIYKDWYDRNCKKFSIVTVAKKDLRANKYILSKFGSCFLKT